MRMRERACASERPSDCRRRVNFRVSKWWSRWLGVVLLKGRREGVERGGVRLLLRLSCWR